MVGASINASAGGGGISTAYGEGYGVLVSVNDGWDSVDMLQVSWLLLGGINHIFVCWLGVYC